MQRPPRTCAGGRRKPGGLAAALQSSWAPPLGGGPLGLRLAGDWEPAVYSLCGQGRALSSRAAGLPLPAPTAPRGGASRPVSLRNKPKFGGMSSPLGRCSRRGCGGRWCSCPSCPGRVRDLRSVAPRDQAGAPGACGCQQRWGSPTSGAGWGAAGTPPGLLQPPGAILGPPGLVAASASHGTETVLARLPCE